MSKIKAISNHDGLCWSCLKSFDKSDIHEIVIPTMGYGSRFDGWSTEIHLCHECYKESVKNCVNLWDMEEVLLGGEYGEHGCTEYKHEDEMLEYIDKLPIQGRQFVENMFADRNYPMEAQDWIDYELGVLSHNKCKEYGLYSHQEIKAYNDNFTTCEYVVNRVFNDGSKGSYCPFGASGNYDQECSCNISTECYKCKYHKKRDTLIKSMPNKDFNDYMQYLKFKIRQIELEKKFG